MKRCFKCHLVKEALLFARNPSKKDGLGDWCRECHKEYLKEWNLKNIDRKREMDAAWRAANIDRKLANDAAWRAANPERVKQNGKNAYARRTKKDNYERLARWRKENYGKYAAQWKRMKQATPAWADRDLMELVYEEAKHRGLEVDHIIPLKGKHVCGLHVYNNTQLLTRTQNATKSNRL
jgi:hypothetical protein